LLHALLHLVLHWALPLQVDTPVKKALLGIALTYIGVMVILPFINVFLQVHALDELQTPYSACAS
jgi:hypothetical protein